MTGPAPQLARCALALLLNGVLASVLLGQAPPPPQSKLDAAHLRPPDPGYKFPNGQTLVYDVEWRLLHAGTASLRMDVSGSEQRVNAAADSTGFVSLLYRVHDRFQAFFDPRTFCSKRIHKHVEEGFRRLETNIRFEALRRKAVLEEKNLKSGASKQTENDIPECVTDVVSGLYYIGSLPLEIGTSYRLPLNDGGQTTEVTVRVEAREQVKTPSGAWQTIRVQPEAASGVVKSRGQVWIWYSDDGQRLPVQMRARMFWGTLTFRLQRIERH